MMSVNRSTPAHPIPLSLLPCFRFAVPCALEMRRRLVGSTNGEISCGIVLPPWPVFPQDYILRYVRTVRLMRQLALRSAFHAPWLSAHASHVPPRRFALRCHCRDAGCAINLGYAFHHVDAELLQYDTSIRHYNAARISSPLCRFSRFLLLRHDVRISTQGRLDGFEAALMMCSTFVMTQPWPPLRYRSIPNNVLPCRYLSAGIRPPCLVCFFAVRQLRVTMASVKI